MVQPKQCSLEVNIPSNEIKAGAVVTNLISVLLTNTQNLYLSTVHK